MESGREGKERGEISRRGMAETRPSGWGLPQPRAMSRIEVVAKLDELPVFCLVDGERRLQALHLAAGTGLNADGSRASTALATEEAVVFWAEPQEAKSAVVQARKQRPDETFAIGTMPLGRAFALAEGWAEAESGGKPFRLRAHAAAVAQLRDVLVRQLEHQNMSTHQLFPVFLCEQLTTERVTPVFLSRVDLISTWEAVVKEAGREGTPPPAAVTVLDLRIVVDAMLQGRSDLGSVRFIGTQRAYDLAAQGTRAASQAEGGEAHKAVAVIDDPDDEPPPLLPHVPERKQKPNEPCLCGSGMKYKKCCGKS